MTRLLAGIVAGGIVLLVHLVTAVQGRWNRGGPPDHGSRIYFANHASHGDFALIWTVLPAMARRRVRPVAGADYWMAGPLRRFVARHVFNAVLIDRERRDTESQPVDTMAKAVGQGSSLILFPEGTRNTTDATLLPFKSGLFHLARLHPDVDLIPVWIANLNRVLPKGELVPVPMLCTVTFGEPMRVAEDEEKEVFLARARTALLALAPDQDAEP